MTQLISDILDRAADLIEPEGAWTQGAYGMWDGARCHCAVGAIGLAGAFILISAVEDWVNYNVEPFLGMYALQLEDWNDAPERTQSEVVSKLREVAAKAREAGR